MKKFSIFNIQFSIFLILAGFLLLAGKAHATGMFLDLDKGEVKSGEVLYTTLYLDTGGESVNTIEADLLYDKNFIQVEAINIGGSFVSFWVDKPDLKIPGIIHFSGITPGGVSISQGEIFRVIFRAKNPGNASFSFANANLFINDGLGTKTEIRTVNKSIKIIEGVETNDALNLEDRIFPEKFSVMRAKDSSIFDNKWFIAFSAMDKESGIDHYEVCELFKCALAESPYLLKNQTPFYRVVVTAYDVNGNPRSSALTSVGSIILLILSISVIIYLCFYLKKVLPKK